MSDETLKHNPDTQVILQAIAELSKRIENIKNRFGELEKATKEQSEFTNAQFEAIREGISHNASRFDRLDANVYGVRSDISNLKADLRDLSEEVKQNQKAPALK